MTISGELFTTPSTLENPMNENLRPEFATNSSAEDCQPEVFSDRRWYLVAVAGTSLSIVSLVCNALIASLLLRKRYSQFYFLGLLSLSDLFLSACYGPVIAMDIIRNRLESLWLSRLWWWYVGELLAMCNVSMTFSSFMIILGTMERYLITCKKTSTLELFRKNRGALALICFALALLLRGTAIIEVKVVWISKCTGLTGALEYRPMLTEVTENWLYGTVFRFYKVIFKIRNITTVFIPFFWLSWLNFRIVNILQRQTRSATMFRFGGTTEHKIRMRSATRLLVLIVCSYLLANFLNVVITAWEYINLQSLYKQFEIYETMTDICSMLSILVCATRLPVYLICNEEIRSAFTKHLCIFGENFRARKGSHSSFESQQNGSLSRQTLPENFEKMGTEFDRIVMAMVFSTNSPKSLSISPTRNADVVRSNGTIISNSDKSGKQASSKKSHKRGNHTNGEIPSANIKQL